MKGANKKGAALILTLILLLVISVMAVSLMFLSQTETWSSMNYRMMSQARYGAESGLNKAANFLMSGSYTAPGTLADPIGSYNPNASPVTAGGAPVVLSANSAQPPNYPAAAVQTAFNAAAQGSLDVGNVQVSYTAYATLLSMSSTQPTIQTWQIISDGTVNGVRNAEEEVSAVLERQVTPLFAYAAFATASGCNALSWTGGGTTDSYDSGSIQMSNGEAVTQQYGGNIGTNGGLGESGNPTTIYGSLSTPRAGVGSCSANNVTAWTQSGGAQVTGGLIQLPQPINDPAPAPPNPLPPTSSVQITSSSCSVCSPPGTLPPGSYGNVSLSGGAIITLQAGTYNVNSLTLSGQSSLVIGSGPVILNVAGQGVSTPFDLTGGSITNATLSPKDLQILYAGNGQITLSGGAQASGVVDAPNASVDFSGGSDWYGAVIGQIVNDSGGAAVHYDRKLQTEFMVPGNWMLDSFAWKKY
jgi:Tfp pilus assembly protein PilX